MPAFAGMTGLRIGRFIGVDMNGEGEREPGPSWARDNWPLIELDEVNQGLDPTGMAIAARPATKPAPAPAAVAEGARRAAAAAGATPTEVEQAAPDSIRAMIDRKGV